MAKRNSETPRRDTTRTTDASAAPAGDTLDQRVVAFAEELGRIAGTFQAKAEGWMDRDALTKQIATVRDGAAELLERIAGGPAKSATKAAAAPARRNAKGRRGGVVDAPGKKHRKAMPADPDASQAASQSAKMRATKTMVKTNRRRGRG